MSETLPEFNTVSLAHDYDYDIAEVVTKLSALSDMSLEERQQVAYAIVGEDIADHALRDSLRQRYCSAEGSLGRTSMKALDGGYHVMWNRAKMRAKEA